MKFFKLDKTNFDLFEDMDPFAMLKDEFPAGRFAMGLFGTHKGYDYPIGLSICTETSDSLVIEWLMVESLATNRGVGSYMIRQLILLAREYKKSKVKAAFYYSPAREILFKEEKIFFKIHGFLEEEKHENVSYLTLTKEYFQFTEDGGSISRRKSPYKLEYLLKDVSNLYEKQMEIFEEPYYEGFVIESISKSKMIAGIDDNYLKKIEALVDLDMQELVEVLNQFLSIKAKGIVIVDQDDFDISMIDLDISCVIKQNDKIEAVLLITSDTKQTLAIRKFIVSRDLNRVSIAYMFKFAYIKMTEKYNSTSKLYISKNSGNSNKLIEGIRDIESED